MGCRAWIVLVGLLLAGRAHASTLGLFPCTADAPTIQGTQPRGAAQLVVARDARALADAWRAAGLAGAPFAVDFERAMVVGVIADATTDRVIYRIQLDDAARATALVVHLAPGDAPCEAGRTPKPARAQLVVTPRSDLPVRFVADAMVDGRLYVEGATMEGVGETVLATVAAPTPPASTAKVATREAAERIALAHLTAAQRKTLLRGPLDRTMTRIPHGWTRVAVTLADATWHVRYDDVDVAVDRATGRVK